MPEVINYMNNYKNVPKVILIITIHLNFENKAEFTATIFACGWAM